MIINGDVKNTVGQMQVSDALLYANNIYQNGAFKITDGSLVLEGNWDVDTEGKTITDVHGTSHGANTKKDALSANITNQQNKTARGSLHVSYAPINIQITLPSTDKKPDNWIDF
ncbi:hypothetical protein [Deefgea sp. CFH1-16]|uniref:hypothetical protein n=1 Tax=Deefgea sp. CFH1-16 TaxID=2675457 RepID=UPI0015F52A8B|nr:hypothetical protein [Deefgea sp. CFH1-16]